MKTIKKVSLFLLMNIFCINSFSQNEIKAVISNDYLNILYLGIENPISIAVPGIPNDKFSVTITNGSIRKDNGKYYIKVNDVPEVAINVIVESKLVNSSIYKVLKLPNPTLSIGRFLGANSIAISRDELLKAGEIGLSSFLPKELTYTIMSFSFSYSSNGNAIEKQNSGNIFTQDLIDAIENTKPNSKFYFESIKVKFPDGTIKDMPSIVIKVIGK
ncbi:MAG: hypothetical protein HXX09_05865 [Bacteroidetes bacterium]|nr:hypothetical protein [Bacteroidota bacterium]